MLIIEDGAMELVEKDMNRYFNHFNQHFPLYEYIDITSNDDFDVSLSGAIFFHEFIDSCIAKDKPVPIPDGYEDRIY